MVSSTSLRKKEIGKKIKIFQVLSIRIIENVQSKDQSRDV
uniref:Uncharacterized protein n=1 Tax=Rhizophora mucronata TaxID=61149 RepID=A0A2P2PBM9_RHIMU